MSTYISLVQFTDKGRTAVAFRSEAKARCFERCLKTGSGREFARRHF